MYHRFYPMTSLIFFDGRKKLENKDSTAEVELKIRARNFMQTKKIVGKLRSTESIHFPINL